MLKQHSSGGRRRRVFAGALTIASAILISGAADAHFRLITPDSWMTLSADGSPQKMGPCGNEAPQMPTGKVTALRPGQTIAIQFMETVFHPGHYRVSLANTQAQIPAEPTVTPGATACGSVPIAQNPTMPVLVDGALVHTAPLNGMQTIMVTIPANFTCTSCVLQVLEFMSSHGAPCFYHHCANLTVSAGDGGVATDGGSDASREASVVPDAGGAGSSGQGGSAPGSGGGGAGGLGAGGAAGTIDPTGTTGGSPSATTTTAGSAGSTTTTSSVAAGGSNGAKPTEDLGCSCTLPGRPRSSVPAVGSLLLLALAVARRRRFS